MQLKQKYTNTESGQEHLIYKCLRKFETNFFSHCATYVLTCGLKLYPVLQTGKVKRQ